MPASDPSPFGELLRRLRTAAALSQEELCERAGLSVRGLSDLERGVHRAPRLETVRLLADALRLDSNGRADLIAAARPDSAIRRPARVPGAFPLPALPAAPTRLIGREAEIATLRGLLAEPGVRLVTLTGPGGVGKSRLALRVATDLESDFGQGIAWVPLSTVHDPAFVAPTVAHALGVREASGRSPLEGLAGALRDRRLLLVLDNFEQVVEAAPFVTELLAACPGLRVLVTSRSVLRVSGEHDYSVPPLALPGSTAPPTELAEAEAVRLFVERARAANSTFVLSQDNAEPVAAICRRLDGLPLAIELAAARLRHLPPDALLGRLKRRLPLLTGGPRDAPVRQQTLQATIAWSYDLLDAADQRLFRHLSVFAGGCTVEAALAVDAKTSDGVFNGEQCETRQAGVNDPLGGIASLLDQSLLQRAAPDIADPVAVEPRFAMLETIREFGLAELEVNGEAEDTRGRHAAWYAALAEQAEPSLFAGRDQLRWLDFLTTEHDNLRAALAWLVETGDAETGQQLAGALPRFWFMRGHMSEGRAWLERTIALGADTPPSIRARALTGLGILAIFQQDYQRAALALDIASAAAEASANTLTVAYAHFGQGLLSLQSGDFVSAVARGIASRAAFESLGEWGRATEGHLIMARVAHYEGDFVAAEALYEEFLTRAQLLENEYIIAHARQSLALFAQSLGDNERALSHYVEALAQFRLCAEPWSVAACLSGLAAVIGTKGQGEAAARLFGAADELHVRTGMPMFAGDRAVIDPSRKSIRAALGDAAFEQAITAGAALSFDEAIAEAMAVSTRAEGGAWAVRHELA